jgi:hypothetical protein
MTHVVPKNFIHNIADKHRGGTNKRPRACIVHFNLVPDTAVQSIKYKARGTNDTISFITIMTNTTKL